MVALNVGTQYLRALADSSEIDNARALLKADEVALNQAVASHDAGVGTNLDVLRARVQLQVQQQALINAENTFAKDKIALNRLMGLPAEQELTLTDTAPYAEFAAMPLDDAMRLAWTTIWLWCGRRLRWRRRRPGWWRRCTRTTSRSWRWPGIRAWWRLSTRPTWVGRKNDFGILAIKSLDSIGCGWLLSAKY